MNFSSIVPEEVLKLNFHRPYEVTDSYTYAVWELGPDIFQNY